MIRLEKRPTPSRFWAGVTPVLAVLATMVAGAILFAALGMDPLESIRTIFWDPLFHENFAAYSRPQLLVKAGPLILIAIGLSLGFRAGIWNIGAEGQYIIGAICGAGAGLALYPSESFVIFPLMVVAGALGGWAWAMIPAALKYLGLDPDSKDTGEIEQAGELLKSIRPFIQKYHSSEYINALANGDICLAVGWSGDVLQARDRAAEAGNGVTVEYSIPKEGAQMWFDQMAVPADAPHKEEAHEFLNYIMRPDVMAKASNYVYYANGNKASQELLNDDVIGDTAIYPDEETVSNLYTTTPYPPKVQRIVTRTWTSVKSGQ